MNKLWFSHPFGVRLALVSLLLILTTFLFWPMAASAKTLPAPKPKIETKVPFIDREHEEIIVEPNTLLPGWNYQLLPRNWEQRRKDPRTWA